VRQSEGPLRLQATTLGQYLLYTRAGRRFVAARDDGTVVAADQPSPDADWRVDGTPAAFRLSLPNAGGRVLAVGPGGRLLVRERARTGARGSRRSTIGATGAPARGAKPFGETRGLLVAHMHMMAFEFIGGSVRCGRPWHPYGVTFALVDCPDHEGQGAGAVLENVRSDGTPSARTTRSAGRRSGTGRRTGR